MNISSVKFLEGVPCVVKVLSADWVKKPVIDEVMDEYDQGHGSDIIDTSTVVFGVGWVKVFRVSVGDYFFSGCVGLGFGSSFSVWDSSGVVSGLVVVALDTEYKMSVDALNF